MPTILVTGSTGFIGSHTLLELFKQNYNVVCIDSGVNKISGKKRISRYSLNLMTDKKELDEVFNNHAIDYCIHFAALKSVPQSIDNPLLYYQNNLISTINLLECFKKYDVKGMIFSSSATVYSPNQKMPLTEESQIGINLTNPYARTKYFLEEIIKDFIVANPTFYCSILRYFNPIGSHNSRLLDEKPKGPPQNLMPNILQVMNGEKEKLFIYGNDYNTPDGTCLRDYIHVEDLANAHVKALQKIIWKKIPHYSVYNVGTSKPTSVLEIVNTLEKYTNNKIPYEIKERRQGDLPIIYCDNKKIIKELEWEPKYSIDDALSNYNI
jgi:UDP-glucose 4-epimerase